MLFFVILDQNDTGVNLTLGRLLQGAFLSAFVLGRILKNSEWTLPNPSGLYFRNIITYSLLLIATSVVGASFFDAYKLNLPYTFEYSSVFVEIIRSPYTRPFFEFLILLYYFSYYVILPKYLFRTRDEIEYLLNGIVRVFYVMLIIGIPEVLINYMGLGYIPKHSVHIEFGYVGERFHALLGEPRDAFPYLLFGLAIVYIRNTLRPELKLPRILIPAVLVALVMTQSASGVIGLGLTAVGLLIYFSVKSLKRLLWAIGALAVVVPLVSFLVSLSPRMLDYIEAFSGLWDILNAGEQLPYLVAVQSSNFLPFWNMWLNLKSMNWFPLLFGSGAGTTNIVNNNLTAIFLEDSTSELMNANAQITRILFESGVIGFLVYLNIFIVPARAFLKKFNGHTVANFLLFSLLIGSSLGHRGTASFIYLGIVIAILTNWSPTRQSPATVRPRSLVSEAHHGFA